MISLIALQFGNINTACCSRTEMTHVFTQESNLSNFLQSAARQRHQCHCVTWYLVYPEPSSTSTQVGSSCGTVFPTAKYSWSLVSRGVLLLWAACCCMSCQSLGRVRNSFWDDPPGQCKKGCTGPLLRPDPLRRFGALGCRFNGGYAGKTDSGGSKQTKQSK